MVYNFNEVFKSQKQDTSAKYNKIISIFNTFIEIMKYKIELMQNNNNNNNFLTQERKSLIRYNN